MSREGRINFLPKGERGQWFLAANERMDVKEGCGGSDGEIESDSSWKTHLTEKQGRRRMICLLSQFSSARNREGASNSDANFKGRKIAC